MKNNSNIQDSEVVIVGAGVSGLVTAYKLRKKVPDMKVTILEASSEVGGQIQLTQAMGDLGAKYIGKDHYHMIELLEDLELEIYPKEIQKPLKKKSTLSEGIFSSLVNFEVNTFLREVDITCKNYRYDIHKIKKNGQKMESFIRNRMLFSKSKKFARFLVRLVSGVESHEVTTSEFMSTCCSCDSVTHIMNIYMDDSDDNFEFDTFEFLERLQERTKDVTIYTGCKVTHIIKASDIYVLKDSRGNNFKTKVVVLAIPWNDIMDIYIYPDLPVELTAAKFPSKYLMTSFLLQYDQPYWRQHGYNGSLYHEGELPMACYEVDPSIIYGFVLHSEDNLGSVNRNLICDTLAKCLCPEMENPVAFSMRSFVQASILNAPQVASFSRLVWGSSAASTVYRGLLNGAVQGGLRAALNALSILHPQTINFGDFKQVKRADAIYDKAGMLTRLTCFINLKNMSIVVLGFVTLTAAFSIKSMFARGSVK